MSIGLQLKTSSCELYEAPFDVRFVKDSKQEDETISTVVQPDLCVVCDQSKLDDAGCIGAPDLIIEILSPSTSKKDSQNKFELYQEYGVKEYWMVHTTDQLVNVFDLDKDRYHLRKIYANPDKIDSKSVTGLKVDLNEIFEDINQ